MVYHALDSPDDDYHALFVLCLLYAMSHNKGKRLAGWLALGKRKAALWEDPFLVGADPTAPPSGPVGLGCFALG